MKVFLLALSAAAAGATRDRFCPVAKKLSFMQVAIETSPDQDTLDQRSGLPFDGYTEMGCFLDETPEEREVKYVSTAVSAARAPKMTPNLCFQFCRKQEANVTADVDEFPLGGNYTLEHVSHMARMNFFALTKGTECTCIAGAQLTASGGGMGKCDAPCQGDKAKFCGNSKGKSTVYSMHHCLGGERHEDAQELLGDLGSLTSDASGRVAKVQTMVQAGFDVLNKLVVPQARQYLSQQLSAFGDESRSLDKQNNETLDAMNAFSPLVGTFDPNSADASNTTKLAAADEASATATEQETMLRGAVRSFKKYDRSVSLFSFLAHNGVDEEKMNDPETPSTSPDVCRAPEGDVPAGGTMLVVGKATAFYYMAGHQDKAEYLAATACSLRGSTECVAFNLFKTESANGDWMMAMYESVERVEIFEEENGLGRSKVTAGIASQYYTTYGRNIEWDKSKLAETPSR